MSSDTAANAQNTPQTPDLANVLTHIKNLEQQKQELERKLHETEERAARMSQKTKAVMQSAMDTLMKKWMDAVETKDDTVSTSSRPDSTHSSTSPPTRTACDR